MITHTYVQRADGAFDLSTTVGGEITPPAPPAPAPTPVPVPSPPPSQGMSFTITEQMRGWASTTGNAIPISNGVPVVFRVFVPFGYTTIGRTAPPTLQFSEQSGGANLEVHQIAVGQGSPSSSFVGNTLQRSIMLQTAGDNRQNAFLVQPGDNYIAIYCSDNSATTMAASFNGGRA